MRFYEGFRWVGRGLVGVLLLASAPATAQGVAGPTTPNLSGELALSVREAITMGIENNLDLEVVRHDPLIADAQELASWGPFDPEAFGEFNYRETSNPVASSLQVGDTIDEREVAGNGGLRGLVPKLGWSYDVRYVGSSLETNSSISDLSPEYRTNIIATMTLPILRGFLWGEPWTQVKLAGIRSDTTYEDFRRQLMDVVRVIEDSYWDLAARKDALRVARKSLETAKELLEQTQAQYEVGVVSKVEVVESEAGVASREFDVIGARNNYENAQDTLIDQILGPFLQPASSLRIVNTDKPEDYRVFNVDVEEASAKAMAQRPELAIVRKLVEQREIEKKFARNQWLPQVDLQGNWGLNGLAGRQNPAPSPFGARAPVTVGRDYFDADNDFFSPSHAEDWSAGAVVSIPLGNVRGRGNLEAARLELRRSHTQLRDEQQRIILEVRDAIRTLGSALEGIEAAESRRRAAAEQLRAERIRLEHGESTPFDVLQREEDLVDAESQKIFALQVYHGSVTGLDRAQGTILRDRNIVVEDAAGLR